MKHKIALSSLFATLYLLCSNSFFQQDVTDRISGEWVWQKSLYKGNNSYVSTPVILGSRKKIAFTKDGTVTTYKNNIEIRVSKYQVSKGISISDKQEHDLITFEGSTYIIEYEDTKKLILTRNHIDGYSAFFKKLD